VSAVATPSARILVVGPDAELAAALHLQAQVSGWSLFTCPGPAGLDALLRAVAPTLLTLVLPATPDASWGGALTAAQGAARSGVRVTMVAPAREIVEPLAAVAGAERALSRAELLSSPGLLGEPVPPRAVAPRPLDPYRIRPPSGVPPAVLITPLPVPPIPYEPASPPMSPPPPPSAPRPPAATPALGGPDEVPSRRTPGRPAPDLMPLIDEELVVERRPPTNARVEVAVSLVSEHNFYVGVTRRIDSGGVFVATSLPPPVGTRVQVRLGLADGRKIDLEGEVAFLRAKTATTGRQPAGCGVRLVGLPGWVVDAVERFFQARQPIVYVPT
jgi:Tfp pilus assembly protein PilZ